MYSHCLHLTSFFGPSPSRTEAEGPAGVVAVRKAAGRPPGIQLLKARCHPSHRTLGRAVWRALRQRLLDLRPFGRKAMFHEGAQHVLVVIGVDVRSAQQHLCIRARTRRHNCDGSSP